jgi:hypothetical protein
VKINQLFGGTSSSSGLKSKLVYCMLDADFLLGLVSNLEDLGEVFPRKFD